MLTNLKTYLLDILDNVKTKDLTKRMTIHIVVLVTGKNVPG